MLFENYLLSLTTPAIYNRGVDYYKKHHVQSLKLTYIPATSPKEESIIINGVVLGTNQSIYHSSAILRNNQLVTYHCDCPYFEDQGEICKHLVALLLDANDQQRLPHQTKVASHWAEKLLKSYEPNFDHEAALAPTASVNIWPKLLFDTNGPQFELEFTLGISKPYVLKSIHQFIERLQDEAVFRYGKDLEFIHHRDYFTQESQFYLDLIMDANTTVDMVNARSHYYIPKGQLLGREMVLSSNNFDHFFTHHLNQFIPLQSGKLTIKDCHLIDKNPTIDLTITDHSAEHYQMALDISDYHVYRTNHHGYIIHQQRINRCSTQFAQKVFPILETIKQNRYRAIIFNKTQLIQFISLVLPALKSLVQVTIDDDLLAELTPIPLDAQMYFDYPHPNTVRGRVFFHYGDLKINPLSPEEHHGDLVRDKVREHHILALLEKYRFSINEDEYMLIGEESIYLFLTQGLGELLPLGQINIEDTLERMKSKRSLQLSMSATMTKGIIELKFDRSKFSKQELVDIIRAYQKGKKYIILKDHSFLDIISPTTALVNHLLTDLDLTTKDLGKDTIKVPAYRGLAIDQLLDNQPDITLEKNRLYKDMLRDIDKPIDTDFAVPDSLNAQLRHYQLVGFRWMKTLAHYQFGGILADDMGLGKTLQAICFLLSEITADSRPSIIVVPTSLIYNWQAELDKFAPTLSYVIISGTADARKQLIERIPQYQLVITSYDSLKRDIDHYSELEFDYCIADEAQYIKNHYTQNAQAIKDLASHIRFALTGTPMENSLADLWSIMDFIMPGYLLRWQKFREIYEIPITRYDDEVRLKRLQQQVAPFLLRRLKKDVLKELPDKIETTLYAQLSVEEEQIYHAQLAQSQQTFLEEISIQGIDRNQIKILALLTRLRQACCHPSLFLENYRHGSSKLNLCLDLVEEKVNAGSQVIIFSQFTSMLDLIKDELNKHHIQHLLLTGQTKSDARMTMVNQFNNEHIPVFLISLKAGGVGLNLVAADTVIHYDPWWNISAQNQATDRAHRIGQDKKVHVIKLIAKDTIEEKIEILQNKKKDLTDAVINEGQTFINALQKEDIAALFDMNIPYIK